MSYVFVHFRLAGQQRPWMSHVKYLRLLEKRRSFRSQKPLLSGTALFVQVHFISSVLAVRIVCFHLVQGISWNLWTWSGCYSIPEHWRCWPGFSWPAAFSRWASWTYAARWSHLRWSYVVLRSSSVSDTIVAWCNDFMVQVVCIYILSQSQKHVHFMWQSCSSQDWWTG